MPSEWEGREYGYPDWGRASKPTPRLLKEWTEDRHPDKRPSASGIDTCPRGDFYVEVIEVRGLGAMRVSADSDPKTGRLRPLGLSCFSSEMLQFGLEAEPGAPKP
jgi:hypothetical protein